MGRKGISALFFPSSKTLNSSPSFPSTHISSSPSHTFSESIMEENVENAESIITKWDPDSSSNTKFSYLFQQDRREATDFLKSVKDLHRAMHFLVSENSTSDKLVLAQKLMQMAIKRLEKEFYQILSANRDQLHPESVSGGSKSSNPDDGEDAKLEKAGQSITEVERSSALAMADLKAIAECMIGSGYGNECVKIYKLIRKSIVDEGLHLLRIKRLRSSQVHKMNWEVLEQMIKNWLNVVKIAVKTLFAGEKVLCNHVFPVSKTIRESCFAEITREGALNLFMFPELVSKYKKSPERIFRFMELHGALSKLWPETESIFDFESTSRIKLQALTSLRKLSHSVCIILSDFQSSIQKDSSRTLVTGGGIHPLTESSMSYLSSLAEYSETLSDIVAECPFPGNSSPFPESYTIDRSKPAASVHLAWLILVLLCKLDRKAGLYKDVALAYLFLTNNLQFIVEKVRTSPLKELLGEEWVCRHTKKVKLYALSYELQAWNKVLTSLPGESSSAMSPEELKDCFRRFNATFEEAYQKQTTWIVPNRKLRDELKVSIARKLVPMYKEFYEAHLGDLVGEKNLEVLVRIGPDDLGNYLSDLFHGTPFSSSFSSSSSFNS
ncbi:hypothetical protein SLEP1_g37573 [Rubroshorea leprosula]|uniref:Exocyst subunit Exo70 family protein n=1 Tax=Rubroshorea leprosula TaxID=152421 RepID=A0AAV5KVN2_9ROSI|nr:hypothetical protein SLEP1_g37573 [Rubroshorea leprosula]